MKLQKSGNHQNLPNATAGRDGFTTRHASENAITKDSTESNARFVLVHYLPMAHRMRFREQLFAVFCLSVFAFNISRVTSRIGDNSATMESAAGQKSEKAAGGEKAAATIQSELTTDERK